MKKRNYSHHNIVPKHTKLSEKQKQELLKQYNCTIDQLPRIIKTDTALMDLDVKVDDVVKIDRFSRTEGSSLFYRRVVNE